MLLSSVPHFRISAFPISYFPVPGFSTTHRTGSKRHMTSITLLTCHSAITSGGAWLGTVLASTQYRGSVVWTFDS